MRRLVGLLLLLASCGDSGNPAEGAGPVASWTAGQADLLDGFGFRWKVRPHRINKIGVELGMPARLTMEGGSWATGEEGSDQADLSLYDSAVSSTQVKLHHGSTVLPTLKNGTAEKMVSVDPEAAGLSGCPQFAVLLRGFDLDTDITHVDGYTIRDIGAGLDQVKLDGGFLSFRARLRLEAGAVPDRIQNPQNAGATGKVHYTVVGLVSGKIVAKAHEYTLKYPAGINPSQPHATKTQQRVTIQGEPGFSTAFVGLTGFNFRLNGSAAIFPGRYMREIQVRNYDFDYAAASGAMTFLCDGYFSNSGPITWALENDFSASFAMIHVADGTWTHHSATATQTALDTYLGP